MNSSICTCSSKERVGIVQACNPVAFCFGCGKESDVKFKFDFPKFKFEDLGDDPQYTDQEGDFSGYDPYQHAGAL